MKKIICLSLITICMYANTEFEEMKTKINPIEKNLIEEDFYGNWTAYSIDSKDRLNYIYNEKSNQPIQLYFSSIKSKLLVNNNKDLRVSFFILKNRIYIGQPMFKVGSPGLVDSEEYKILGKAFNDKNKLCYLLDVNSSIFESTKQTLLCKES